MSVFSLVDATVDTLRQADVILSVFDGYRDLFVRLMITGMSLHIMWVGIDLAATGQGQVLRHLVRDTWRVGMALLLSAAAAGAVTTIPPLHDIAYEFQSSIVSGVQGGASGPSSSAALQQNFSREIQAEIKSRASGDEQAQILGAVLGQSPTASPGRINTNYPALISFVANLVNVDTYFTVGFFLFVSGGVILSAAAIAGGAAGLIIIGNGVPNIGWGIVMAILPLFTSLMMSGLFLCGVALAITINFFLLDLQLRILVHVAPIFLLGYAFKATEPYAQSWTKALLKNMCASIFMVICTVLAARVIDTAGASVAQLAFGMMLFLALSRYGQQLAADLVGGGPATPSEDVMQAGYAAQNVGSIERGVGGGLSGISSSAQASHSYRRQAEQLKDGKINSHGIANVATESAGGSQTHPPRPCSSGSLPLPCGDFPISAPHPHLRPLPGDEDPPPDP